MKLDDLLDAGAPPIIAILRGIRPDEALDITAELIDAGIGIIEVPLNSPQAFDSIRAMQNAFGKQACIGAGTVLDSAAVAELAATGAELMVTPNTVPALIAQGLAAGLTPMPGFVTPSEAFAAIAAGARHLKFFPASSFTPTYLKALREVLPKPVCVWAVGGTGASNLGQWLAAGARGIGVGGALYRPGDTAAAVATRARALVSAWQEFSGASE